MQAKLTLKIQGKLTLKRQQYCLFDLGCGGLIFAPSPSPSPSSSLINLKSAAELLPSNYYFLNYGGGGGTNFN